MKWRSAIGTLLARDDAPRRPGSALQHTRQGKGVDAEPQAAAHQRQQAVEQAHGQGAPAHHEGVGHAVDARPGAGVARHDHPHVGEQAAVAILGEPGERVDAGDAETRGFERLDQGIGQPLRELVQRDIVAGGGGTLEVRVGPAIAERHAGENHPVGPDGPEPLKHGFQDRGGRQQTLGRAPRQRVEQAARAGRVLEREEIGTGRHGRSQPVQQCRAAGRARQRFVGRRLKCRLERGGLEPAQSRRVGPQRILGIVRERAAREPAQTREREALRAAGRQSGRRVPKAPARMRTRIEKDRRHRQIDGGPGLGACCRGGVRTVPRAHDFPPEIAAGKHEVPPPGMQRRIEPRVAFAHDVCDEVRGGGQAVEIDGPVCKRTAFGELQHADGAVAHGRRGEQGLRVIGGGRAVAPLNNP